ncbi:response regulator transcription factor [Acidovorax sp. Be4]|uniref:Response regulator transcription factor n=1 Tax=Acidovorax bellezanensis TaxID=2976702 RepID=A0ABT2PQZ7_9BURK|nr:response regulator transcription factor [Acidovorax sp. Be4]MCT9812908.1 response regulator transcription factor [Acidovorax sp. Be4]
MQVLPVLMVTQDAALWRDWQQIGSAGWLPARGQSLLDLARWKQQERQLVVLDAELPRLPDWSDEAWNGHFKGLKVLVLSARPGDDSGRQALARGACGYAHSYTAAAVLDRILQNIDDGNIWMGRTLLQRLLQDVDSRLPAAGSDWAIGLTQREQEVARHAAIGESNIDIAERLGISERTVRAHLSAVFEKLQVSDRLMLALKVHGIHG